MQLCQAVKEVEFCSPAMTFLLSFEAEKEPFCQLPTRVGAT